MQFVGLSPEGPEAIPQIEAYTQQYGITWPIGYGNGLGAGETFGELRLVGYPTKIVVGRDGIIRWMEHSSAGLSEAIQEALQ